MINPEIVTAITPRVSREQARRGIWLLPMPRVAARRSPGCCGAESQPFPTNASFPGFYGIEAPQPEVAMDAAYGLAACSGNARLFRIGTVWAAQCSTPATPDLNLL